MKKCLHVAAFLFAAFTSGKINAQCDFNVTIKPGHPIFCPGGSDTLSTQVYDSYQWYKNNQPIPGATNRALIIQQEQDEGALFRVTGTKNKCTDTSRNVLADGYVFNPPIIIETGDVGVYYPNKDALIECPEDTLILTLGTTYSENIQWFNNSKKIPGAHDQSYYVTKKGSYTVCGAPSVCPAYIVCESLPVNVTFEIPVATITERNDTLFASAAKKYQWYLSNQKIAGATNAYYVPQKAGVYKVAIIDKAKCQAISDPFSFTPGLTNRISVAPNPVKDVLRVHINATDAKQIVIVDLYGNQKLKMMVTGNDQSISVQTINAGTYVLQVLNSKAQQIATATIIKE